mmetsp:Transcript_37150/g.75230  ORF Transcript_37150/g.75230 Transcript_37150/m.75230 type:complete len:290 (-) Transcript_37150:577-1446(-)
MHIFDSRSSKNFAPIWLASRGMCWMMARRTRHWRSSASSVTAGRRDCARASGPMTALTAWSLEMMLRRASWCSSLSSPSSSGTSCSIVCRFPTTGASPIMTDASAARTCWEGSAARSRMQGSTWLSAASTGILAQKSATFAAAAVRTSASASLRSFTSPDVISPSTASADITSHSSVKWSATMYRTRHDLSCCSCRITGKTRCCVLSAGRTFPSVTQLSTATMRTESCSSCASFANSGATSSSTPPPDTSFASPPSALHAAFRTIGMSSLHSWLNIWRISVLAPSETLL